MDFPLPIVVAAFTAAIASHGWCLKLLFDLSVRINIIETKLETLINK